MSGRPLTRASEGAVSPAAVAASRWNGSVTSAAPSISTTTPVLAATALRRSRPACAPVAAVSVDVANAGDHVAFESDAARGDSAGGAAAGTAGSPTTGAVAYKAARRAGGTEASASTVVGAPNATVA